MVRHPAGMTRTPPYSVLAEKALLGSLLERPEMITEVKPLIPRGDVFFRSQHGQLYDTMVACHDAGALDESHLTDALDDAGLLGTVGGTAFLTELKTQAPASDRTLEFAGTIRDKALLRRLIDTASDIVKDAYHADDGYESVLERGQASLAELARELSGQEPEAKS